jgi:hypothetical protein
MKLVTIYCLSAPAGTLHPGDIPSPEVDLIKPGWTDQPVTERRNTLAGLYHVDPPTALEIRWAIIAPKHLETVLKRLLRPWRFPMRRKGHDRIEWFFGEPASKLLDKHWETVVQAAAAWIFDSDQPPPQFKLAA